jgi:hypothetical protein
MLLEPILHPNQLYFPNQNVQSGEVQRILLKNPVMAIRLIPTSQKVLTFPHLLCEEGVACSVMTVPLKLLMLFLHTSSLMSQKVINLLPLSDEDKRPAKNPFPQMRKKKSYQSDKGNLQHALARNMFYPQAQRVDLIP